MFCMLLVQKVLIFKIFMSRLADSTSHPLVHLTLARLFQNLNRWKILQNKTFHYHGERIEGLSSMLDVSQARGSGPNAPGGFPLVQEGVGGFEGGGALPYLARS